MFENEFFFFKVTTDFFLTVHLLLYPWCLHFFRLAKLKYFHLCSKSRPTDYEIKFFNLLLFTTSRQNPAEARQRFFAPLDYFGARPI